MFYMLIYITLAILTEHWILSLFRAKLPLFIRFNTYGLDLRVLGVKNFSVGTCDGVPSTARSSFNSEVK